MDKVVKIFEENFQAGLELGASVSIWKNGEEILFLHNGYKDRARTQAWREDTIVPVYSATKAAAAATLLHALSLKGYDEHTLVTEVWEDFPISHATFAELLSHQCGLIYLDEKVSVFDYPAVIQALEKQTPVWQIGNGHGYHPRTFGFLLDEPVRKITGVSLGEFWRREIAAPLGLDFWIGLPQEEFHRVAELVPGRAEKSETEQGFYKELMTAGTLTQRAFSSPQGLRSVQEMNEPAAWQASLPAMGGIGTARALAKFYQAMIGKIDSPFSLAVRNAMAHKIIQGDDKVLLQKTAFSCGCQLDPLNDAGEKIRTLYGSNKNAFGHPGAGGSHAFGDPTSGISFCYVMNQMALGVMPGTRSTKMVNEIFPAR